MRKNKKKNNNLKRNLLLFGFLLIVISFMDIKSNKKDISLIAFNESKSYTNVNAKELINILTNKTGVVLIVDDKRDVNKIISILDNLKKDEEIYVYNASSDELVLAIENGKLNTKQEASKEYKELLNKLGSYTEEYFIDEFDTDYRKIYTPMVLFVKEGSIEYSYYISVNLEEDTLNNIYSSGFARIED